MTEVLSPMAAGSHGAAAGSTSGKQHLSDPDAGSSPASTALTGSGYRPSPHRPAEFYSELKKSFQRNIIVHCDMNNELQSESMDLIISALDKYRTNYEQAARQIKEQMDKKFGSYWHCIVGEGFGYECTYQQQNSIMLYYQGQVAILLFKC